MALRDFGATLIQLVFTVAGAAAGAYFGNPILGAKAGAAVGAAVGGVVGSLVANELIYPDGRIGDSPATILPDLTNTAEGGPAIYAFGSGVRVRGQLIWMSTVFIDNGHRTAHVAIAVNRRLTNSLFAIYADGYKIFTTIGTRVIGTGQVQIRHFLQTPNLVFTRLDSPGGQVDLTQIKVGGGEFKITLSGFSKPQNNAAKFLVLFTGRFKSGGGTYVMLRAEDMTTFLPTPSNFDEGITPNVTVTEKITIGVNRDFAKAITFHDGTAGQALDPLMVQHQVEPVAHEGLSYYVIDSLRLTQFGNRVPLDTTHILVADDATYTLGDVIRDVFAIGAAPAHPDGPVVPNTDGVTGALDQFRGFVSYGNNSIVGRMQSLITAYNLLAQVRDDTVYIFTPDNARISFINEFEFGITSAATGAGIRFSPERSDSELPSGVTLHFSDVDKNLEDAAVDEHKTRNEFRHDNMVNVDLRAHSLTVSEARSIALRILWEPSRQRQAWRGSLPANFYYLLENDAINTTVNGEKVKLLIKKIDQGAMGTIELEGFVITDPITLSIAESSTFEDFSTDDSEVNDGRSQLTLAICELPALTPDEIVEPSYYLPVASYGERRIESAQIQQTCDCDGVTFEKIADVVDEAAIGIVVDGSDFQDRAIPNQFDRESSIDVVLFQGTLRAHEEPMVLCGSNLACVDGEVFAFSGVEDLGFVDDELGRVYRLTTMLRGMMDTDPSHRPERGVQFVMLTNHAALNPIRIPWGSIGSPRTVRATTGGDVLDDEVFDADTFTPLAHNLRPFAVVNITGSIDGSDNWNIFWVRRSRYPGFRVVSQFNDQDVDARLYQVEILDGPNGTIKRSTTGVTESFQYLSADQVTDFGSNQTRIYVRISRIGTWGIGKPAEATLPGDIVYGRSNADGVATAVATGKLIAGGKALADGVATATARGVRIIQGTATAAGTSTATADGNVI